MENGLGRAITDGLGLIRALGLGSLSLRALVPERNVRLVLVAGRTRWRARLASGFGRVLRIGRGTGMGSACASRKLPGVVGTTQLDRGQSVFGRRYAFPKRWFPWRRAVRGKGQLRWAASTIRLGQCGTVANGNAFRWASSDHAESEQLSVHESGVRSWRAAFVQRRESTTGWRRLQCGPSE